MRLLKVGAAVINQTPLDWAGNQARISALLAEARQKHVGLVCLPELCVTGYGCEDAFHSRGVQRRALEVLAELVPQTKGLAACVGLPVLHHNALYNCAALMADGRLLGFTAKQHLAGDGIHYEPRWFRPWPFDVRATVDTPLGEVPIGDLFYDLGGLRVGFEICEDAWVAGRPGARLSLRGVDVILNPSASHFAFGKHRVRERLVQDGSRAFGVTYVYSNLLGNEAGRVVYDGDTLIATGGVLLAQGPRFSFQDHLLTTAVVDVDATRTQLSRTTSFVPDPSPSPLLVRDAFELPQCAIEPPGPPPSPWQTSPDIKEEEFARAEALALHDYFRKSRSAGGVLSLSGGADSSAVATLVALSVHLCVQELGLEGLKARFSYVPGVQKAQGPKDAVRALLLCVYQATRNSSQATRDSARALATALGADFLQFEVDHLVDSYVSMVGSAIGRQLTWEKDDLSLQNIQARARAPGVWMLANLRGGLLLSTSNRSEAAVGYATMDGDTSGGLAPIAGIDKHFLRRFLRWMEARGPEGLFNLPALAAVNRQAPGPELRPPEAGQTGEKDLMPYDVLDAVERCAALDRMLPVEVYTVLRTRFPEHAPKQLATWIERFFTLFARNQWKRERYAPTFHLDDESLDPKTWFRFPILSSGFAEELRALWRLPELSG